ncbi:IS21 family transposase [Massilia sp. TWP1-3-3]|uniref:IS21 family transposase n=1 Tax=Massilia sp. TWP1-3-3 TaxID=2804573 RepID=UPI003CEC2ACE
MAVDLETEAKILRLHHVEKWRNGTIARHLAIHHGVVERVLSQDGLPGTGAVRGSPMFEPYLPLILQTLEKYPSLTASRLYGMMRERGYPGGPDHFRHVLAHHRPRAPAEAYLRLRTLPGEQCQCDWAHFDHLTIGRARRPLMAFVMVLSYSRLIYLRFFLNARMENFLRGHVGAFDAFGGCSRVVLYDNLKSAVLEREGQAIRFHPTLLALAKHYRFEPRPVAICRGNQKGRVERAIRYIRSAFFAARQFHNLADLNTQAAAWCAGQASDRPCPQEPALTVREAFRLEKPLLLPLPVHAFPSDERVEVSVGKTPYVRFDLNDYSIPHTYVRRTLTVHASEDTVRVLDGADVISCLARSYDKGAQVEEPAHIEQLAANKRKARHHRGIGRLAKAAPASVELIEQAAKRSSNLGTITAGLLRLLERFGADELQAAILEALERGVPHPNAVRLALERRREQRGQAPPVAMLLPEHVVARDAPVRTHSLESYDQLSREHDDDEQT